MKFNAIIATLIDRMETSQSLLKWALIFKLYGLTQVTSCSFSLFFVCCVIVRIIVSCVIWDLLIKAEKCKLDLIVWECRLKFVLCVIVTPEGLVLVFKLLICGSDLFSRGIHVMMGGEGMPWHVTDIIWWHVMAWYGMECHEILCYMIWCDVTTIYVVLCNHSQSQEHSLGLYLLPPPPTIHITHQYH